MAFGISSVLNMGVGALFASQASIQTTGNNISNVNTPGYSRQAVVLQTKYGVNSYPGQVGQGVEAKEVVRYFDAFVESAYLDKFSSASGYHALYSEMRYVENLFNEANVDGLGSALTAMFTAWNKLSQQADSLPTREALLSAASTLTSTLNNADKSLKALEEQMNNKIRTEVDSANQLMQEIALLNKEIAINYTEGRNNPNALMDARDAKVRELAGIIDIQVSDRGPGDYTINMKNGTTLVQNDVPFSLEFRGPQAENNLTVDSPYRANGGTVHFDGTDSREYTLEMVSDGKVGSDATFKVSLDGGKTWLTDDDGNVKLFKANEGEGNSVRVGNLDVWFDSGRLAQGDRFTISPKSDVYWNSPTSGPINISPQLYGDGTKNSVRIQGGTLGGYLEFRDYHVGEYRERLASLSKSIAWEVNRVHSQGVGLKGLSSAMGTYRVGNTSVPMGSSESRFSWADRLTAGNVSFAVFDAETGKSMIPYPGLDIFSSLPGGNFDPSKHSLEDVRDAINAASFHDKDGLHRPFSATIVDGKLQITTTDPKYSFSITSDTTGLGAALGINTFFTGDSAETFAVREELRGDTNLINAGRVSTPGEITPGDNQIAKEIAALLNKKIDISTTWSKSTNQTLGDYYATLVTKVGSDTASVKFTAASETAMAQDLYDRQEEIKGVNLDEEMSNLIKYQASYKAAAKLITTANEMMQTLLSMKQ